MAEALIFLVLICLIASDYKKLNSNSARGAAFRIGYCLISMLMLLPRRQIASRRSQRPSRGRSGV